MPLEHVKILHFADSPKLGCGAGASRSKDTSSILQCNPVHT